MWGKEPNSEATEWMGSLQGWVQGTPHLRGLLGTCVLQLGAPPSVAPSQACFFESSVAPAAPSAVGPQSRHRHTRVCLLYGGGAPGEGHSLGTQQEAANGILPAEG